MNSEPAIVPLPEPPDPVHPAFGNGHRGNGKVARLPKTVRDQINTWILDGVSYPDIIQRLGEHGKDLKPNHLYEWKKRGHQDWLLERDWLDRLSSKAEFSSDILAAPNSASLHEAGLRIAASQMFDQLMRFTALSATAAESEPDPTCAAENQCSSVSIRGSSESPQIQNQNSKFKNQQPEIFARLVNALSRLTREALAFQKYRDAAAKSAAETVKLEQKDPDRDLSDTEIDLVVNKWDHAFKVSRRKPGSAALPGSAGFQPAVSHGEADLRPSGLQTSPTANHATTAPNPKLETSV